MHIQNGIEYRPTEQYHEIKGVKPIFNASSQILKVN